MVHSACLAPMPMPQRAATCWIRIGGGVDKIQMLLQPQASRGLRMMMAEVQPTLMIAGVGV